MWQTPGRSAGSTRIGQTALAKIDEKEAIETQLMLEAITKDPFFDELESSTLNR